MDINVVPNINAVSALFDDAPAIIVVLKGPDLVMEYANKMALGYVGKTEDIFGLPIRESLPELNGLHIFEKLEEVYQSGIPFKTDEVKASVDLARSGNLTDLYFNLVYMPVRTGGQVTGIFAHAVDITAAVTAKKNAEKSKEELEYSREKLRAAIEVANLGTWERDLIKGTLTMNGRLMEWRGTRDDDSFEGVLADAPDKEKILAHIKEAMNPDSDGIIDIEVDMRNPGTGETKRLHSQGRVFFNEERRPVLMTGITHDVTVQRHNEAELENKVALKTKELAEANNELQQMNQSLEQFVYIASHDLQEPLRKINVFSDMLLKSKNNINEEGTAYLSKIAKAAQRMSLLINNLLEFSQVSSKEKVFVPVDLNRLLAGISVDYELLIKQTNAVLNIDALPVIEAIPLQMYQLFYNLVGNALKFAKKDVPAVINISCTMLSKEDIRDSKLNPKLSWCNIIVADNGIGFEKQYSSRIFEIFQRLHGKQEYAGTGIGLSLARKIAENHGGTITADSDEKTGAVFSVILPVSR